MQRGHAEFGNLQCTVKEAGRCPIQVNLRGLDLQVRCLPAELANVKIAEQLATGVCNVQLSAGSSFGQLDGGLQAAFTGRQPTDATDDGSAGEEG